MSGSDALIAGLTAADIPMLARSRQALSAFANQTSTVPVLEIATAIHKDPLLTLAIIAAVNHRRSGAFTEITTVEHAIMMFGLTAFFSRFLQLPVLEERLSGEALSGIGQALTRSRHAAVQARDFAALRLDTRAEEVYIGALLHDLPEVLLWLADAKLALQVKRRSARDGAEEAQRALLGTTFGALRPPVAKGLHLPETLIDLATEARPERARVMLVHYAASLAAGAERGWWQAAVTNDIQQIADLLRQSPDAMTEIVHRNAVSAARDTLFADAWPAARWLPMLPGEWPPEPGDEEQSSAPRDATTELAPPAPAPGSEPHPEPAAAAGEDTDPICLAPQATQYDTVMREIAAHLDGSLTLNQMTALILRGLHDGIGLNRVVFALMTADRSGVQAKFTLGIGADDALRHFGFPLNPPSLLSMLMTRMQGLWFNEENEKTYGPMIPEGVKRQIGPGGFYAMSLHVHGKPIGLVYADRGHHGCELDAHSYEAFKQLCLRAAEGLAHLATG